MTSEARGKAFEVHVKLLLSVTQFPSFCISNRLLVADMKDTSSKFPINKIITSKTDQESTEIT